MSQDYTSENRKARRAARTNRNRPVLVTSASEEQEAQTNGTSSKEGAPSEVASAMPVQELPPLIIPTPAPTKPKGRTLPGFLPSRKNTDEQPKEAKESDIAQARLARATRKIPPATSKTTDVKEKDEKPAVIKASTPAATSKATSSASARPASPFKTRYIFGMVLYLLCANFIGVFEQGILQSYHLDAELTRFNLFGGTIIIRTSTLVFLLTLVIILVILARLDLIPRSLGAAMGTPARKTTSTSNASANGERTQQPTMRQGVQGADDKLYQEYRTAQRREKKK
jgi:hypothetical protein